MSILRKLSVSVAVMTAATSTFAQASDTAGKTTARQPIVAVAERLKDLSSLSNEVKATYCPVLRAAVPLQKTVLLSGPIETVSSNSQTFLNGLFVHISAYFNNPQEHYAALAKIVSQAAESNAYTELAPYSTLEEGPNYNVWNEPAYQQALLLTPVSVAYLIALHQEPENKDLHKKIENWGAAIFASASAGKDDFIGRVKGIDRVSMKSIGYAYWANATGNTKALDMANKGFREVLTTIARDGADKTWQYKGATGLFYANMTWASLVATAHALKRTGVPDVYTMTNGGGNVVNASNWLIKSMTEKSEPILKARASFGSRTTSWLELLMADNMLNAEVQPATRQALEQLTPPRYAAFAGGPVTCLFRPIAR